jgi:hypothetical protein
MRHVLAWCSAHTRHVAKVRLSTDSPHRVGVLRLNTNFLGSILCFPFSSMLDAASSADMAAAAGLSTSIPPSATGPAAVTVAAASPEANMRSPSGVDVTATAGARRRNMCTGLVGWHRRGRRVTLSSSCSPRKGSTLRYWNCAA